MVAGVVPCAARAALTSSWFFCCTSWPGWYPAGGTMPTLSKLAKDGSVTWSAAGVTPALRLPTMASIITGVPVEKHGINWNTFEFSRGYPRAPSMFDYLDLSGGRDSAIFFMDESLYQLARPEPYTDYQMCGPLKPECGPERIVSYIQQYFRKATSGHGYGHAILSLPHLLVVHLPEAGRVGAARGWNSKEYRDALRAVDKAINSVLEIYKAQSLINRTTIFVTSLSAEGKDPGREQGDGATPAPSACASIRTTWAASATSRCAAATDRGSWGSTSPTPTRTAPA